MEAELVATAIVAYGHEFIEGPEEFGEVRAIPKHGISVDDPLDRPNQPSSGFHTVGLPQQIPQLTGYRLAELLLDLVNFHVGSWFSELDPGV
ncbi:hypothetical protein NMK54_17440 [Nocardia otitidiscaviarum]|nr:hypothetical protein [Nocardia otitidiscaviarum]MCP9621935.1 hypothetical protein [Nocardia otitidiscaviarum]